MSPAAVADPETNKVTPIDGTADPEGAGSVPPTPPANLPDEGAGDDEQRDPLLFLLGHKQLGVKVAGRKPDSSIMKVKGGKIELEGQFDRGERFPAVFDLQVTGDADRDAINTETGEVRTTRKTQEATVCGTSTLSAFLARKLAGHDELLSTVLDLIGLDGE